MVRGIGYVIAKIGAALWEKGGWTGDERYEDLTMTGKLGYRLFVMGLNLMGVTTPEEVEKMLP